jgi:hypothetical protein
LKALLLEIKPTICLRYILAKRLQEGLMTTKRVWHWKTPVLSFAAGVRVGKFTERPSPGSNPADVWQRDKVVATLLVLVGLTLSLISCSEKNPSEPSGSGGSQSKGSITASIGGVSWSANSVVTASNVPPSATGTVGVLTIYGFELPGARSIRVIAGYSGTGIGTYTVPGSLGTGFVWTEGTQAQTWDGTSGSVTITTFTATRVAGTFSFTATARAASGATGTRLISNGSFDVTF